MLWSRRARPASRCRRRSLRVEKHPRATHAEATRVETWSCLDSNGVTLFAEQYDRGTCCEVLLAMNTWYRYLIRSTCGLRITRKKLKCLF